MGKIVLQLVTGNVILYVKMIARIVVMGIVKDIALMIVKKVVKGIVRIPVRGVVRIAVRQAVVELVQGLATQPVMTTMVLL